MLVSFYLTKGAYLSDKSLCFIEVSDANGDKIAVIGPFNSLYEAQAYRSMREDRKGRWFLEVRRVTHSVEKLDWKPGEDAYAALFGSGNF